MQFIFVDDSKQKKPTRPGMGPLNALGGVFVSHDALPGLEREIETLCGSAGFARTDEFKWSPRSGDWMYGNLTNADREAFFLSVVDALAAADVCLNLCAVDESRNPANWDCNPEEDVTRLYIERADRRLKARGQYGVIIADRPGGGRKAEDDFMAHCAKLLEVGTTYVKPERIAMNVLTADSKMVRLLQAADLVTGCTLAYVSGEKKWSPAIFTRLLPLFYTDSGRRGGVSAKLHPDFVFGNLYHWLFADTHLWKYNMGVPLPLASRPYASSPDLP